MLDTKIVAPRGQKFTLTGSTKHSVSFRWVDEFLSESTFIVQRRTGNGGWSDAYQAAGDFNVTCNTLTGVDYGAAPGTYYCYRLKIQGALGASYSPESCTYTQALQLPPAPTNLRQTSNTDSTISVRWDYSGSNHEGFIVANINLSDDDEKVGTSVREHTFEGMSPGRTYNVRVAAYNGDGRSDWVTIEGKTSGQAPTPCPGGGSPTSFTFCQKCNSNVTPQITVSQVACTKDVAKAIVHNQAINCTISDGPC